MQKAQNINKKKLIAQLALNEEHHKICNYVVEH